MVGSKRARRWKRRILPRADLRSSTASQRWVQSGGLASEGAGTLVNDCSPEITLPVEVALQGNFHEPNVYQAWREADVSREETGECTGRKWRGMGPSTFTRIAEITSGSTNYQQGLAATCEDLPAKGKPEPVRGIWWGA